MDLSPLGATTIPQDILYLKFNFPKHLSPDHTHLVHDEETRLRHSSLHLQVALIRTARPGPTVTHRHAENTMQCRRAKFQLKRRAPRGSCQ